MPSGALYSFTDTGIEKRGISDVIFDIDWREAPLLNIFRFDESNVNKFRIQNFPQRKVEIIEDTMPVRVSTLSAGINNSTLAVPVATGDGELFRTGDIVAFYNASGAITEKGIADYVTGDTVTLLARGYGTTSAVTHDSGDTVKIIGRAMPENAQYTTGYTTLTSQSFNYSQIISEAAEASNTEIAISKYGVDDILDYQVAKLFVDSGSMGLLPQYLQDTFYYGEAVERDANNRGTMGGFKYFVSTNVTNMAGAPVQRDHIHTKLRQIRQAGGKCTHLITGGWGVEKIYAMYEGLVETTNDETRGGGEITTIKTPHGMVEVVFDYRCPESEWYFVNAEKIGWLPIRPFERKEIVTRGDGVAQDVVGEFTFMLANEKSHGYLHSASTTE